MDEEKKDDPVAYISFSNESDGAIANGVRFGEAEWNASLASGANTWATWGDQGVEVEPGSYNVEMKDGSGNWIVVSSGTLTAEEDHVYDVVIDGTWPGSITFYLYDWGIVDKSAPQELKIKELKINEIPTNSVKYIEK